MAAEIRYCPHCGARVGRDAYTGAALCYKCDRVFGWEATTDTPSPGTDRRRAIKAHVAEVAGGIVTVALWFVAMALLMCC